MIYEATMTDTFAGEANYCWVKKCTFTADDNATTRTIVRKVKALLCVTGKHETDDYGDEIAIYPRGAAFIIFVRPCPEEQFAF